MHREPQIKEPTVSFARRENINELMDTFRFYVRDRNSGIVLESEIYNICLRIAGSIEQSPEYDGYKYLVICDDNAKAVGIIGLRPPEEDMLEVTEGMPSLEMINVFVNPSYGRQGLGKKLTDMVFKYALSMGYRYVVWNSGPRYKAKGHKFYTKHFGEPITTLIEKYGEGGDAPVWRVDLEDLR